MRGNSVDRFECRVILQTTCTKTKILVCWPAPKATFRSCPTHGVRWFDDSNPTRSLALTPESGRCAWIRAEHTLGGYRGGHGHTGRSQQCRPLQSIRSCMMAQEERVTRRRAMGNPRQRGLPVAIGKVNCVRSISLREGGVETAPLSNHDLAQQRSTKPSHRICTLVLLSQKYLHLLCLTSVNFLISPSSHNTHITPLQTCPGKVGNAPLYTAATTDMDGSIH